jgi:hypothetical protein
VALWTCRCAWTTRRALPTCPQQSSSRRRRTSSRDSRLTPRLHRCQKPDSQNASRPGRHQIGTVGEIISESWARSNRYTRARSSESAETALHHRHLAVVSALVGNEMSGSRRNLLIDRVRGFSILLVVGSRRPSPHAPCPRSYGCRSRR